MIDLSNDCRYPGQGTQDDWYHLLQPHEDFSIGPLASATQGGYAGIGQVLNRWWVKGTAVPDSSDFAGYFEVMVSGNVLLPEDLDFIIAEYSGNAPGQQSPGLGPPGLWGTPLGDRLRNWLREHNRPLIWSDSLDGPMLIDPLVGAIGGASYRITQADRDLFQKDRNPWAAGSFEELAAEAAPHLHFFWPSYLNRTQCEAAESDPVKMVMGVDGDGNCVYWVLPAVSGGSKWELLNDGTCEQSGESPDRAVHESEASCLASVQGWSCVRDIPNASFSGAAYCLPQTATLRPGPADGSSYGRGPPATMSFGSVDACEAGCVPEDPSKGFECSVNFFFFFEEVLPIGLLCGGIAWLVGMCAVARLVAPKQQFSAKVCGCARVRVCCLPCFQPVCWERGRRLQ